MLSDDAIEKLMQPIIDRQQNINTYVIELIAKRVKEIGELSPSDVYKLERLLKTGADARQINTELARLTGLQVRDIKKMIRTVALDGYFAVKPYYDYRHKSFIPFDKNKELQKVVNAIANQTAQTYVNISNSRAIGFVIRDFKRPTTLKFQSIGNTYQTVIDEAIQAVSGGVVDFNTAMTRTMEQLANSGIRVVWENGYTQRLDTAVRRNLQDGIRAINQGVQDEVGRQFNADGKEITVHANSAPDHEPIQGHQFTNEEYEKLQNAQPFKDVQGNEFTAINRAIGTLNCRHFSYSIIVGLSRPMYTQAQLDEMIKRNHAGYTMANGKHLSLYECAQYQRRLETKIRESKDGIRMARNLGNEKLEKKFKNRLAKYQNQYRVFSKKTGLRTKPARLGGKI